MRVPQRLEGAERGRAEKKVVQVKKSVFGMRGTGGASCYEESPKTAQCKKKKGVGGQLQRGAQALVMGGGTEETLKERPPLKKGKRET